MTPSSPRRPRPARTFLPRVAALLDVAQVSEISKVISPDTFERPIYAGNAVQTVQATDSKKVITVRTSTFAATGEGGSAAIEADQRPGRSGPVELQERGARRLRPPRADLGQDHHLGRPRDAERGQLQDLYRAGGRHVSARRWAPRARRSTRAMRPTTGRSGQTGKVVAPELYIAVGISGAIQHLAGMKDSKVIVAINKDEEAPIFQVADYGLVADLYSALPELSEELKKIGR